jgi:hypothetical protein
MAFAFTAITMASALQGIHTPEHELTSDGHQDEGIGHICEKKSVEITEHLFEAKVSVHSVDMDQGLDPFETWLAKIDIQVSESEQLKSLGFDLNSIWDFDKSLLYAMMRDLGISVISCKRIISAVETIEKGMSLYLCMYVCNIYIHIQ